MPIGVDGLVRQWTPSQSVHRQGAVTGIPGAGEDGTCDAVYGWGGAARLHSAPPNSRLERIHWPTRLAIRRCIIRNSRAWTLPSPAPAAAGTRAKVAASIDAARKGGDATSGEYMPDPPRPTPEQSCCEPVARTSARVRYRCRVPRFPDLRMKPSDHHISCVQSASTYRYRPS